MIRVAQVGILAFAWCMSADHAVCQLVTTTPTAGISVAVPASTNGTSSGVVASTFTTIAPEVVPQYHVNPLTETPDFITFWPGLYLPEAQSGDPVAVALGLFTSYPLLYGTGDVPNQLHVRSAVADEGPNPMYHVVLQQVYAGLPVFGCELRVHISASLAVQSVSGNYLRNPGISTDYSFGRDGARESAIQMMESVRPTPVFSFERSTHREQVEDAELTVLPGALLENVSVGNHVVWRFRFPETDLFVSAVSGEVVFAIPNTHSARQVYDAGLAKPISLLIPLLILSDGQTVSSFPQNAEIQSADSMLATTLGFWSTLGRTSWDGRNSDTGLVTNGAFPFPNAQWVMLRNQMWFAPGMVRGDVVGHEFTHGVIQESAGLLYIDESGALNEHYADVMGNLAFADSPATNWFVGETGPGGAGALRDMVNPAAFGHPANYASYVPRGSGCTAPLDPLNNPGCDFGNVHTNSGIGNRAAVLLADGDGTLAHPGIGRARVARLFADTLTTRMHSWSVYLDELHNTWETARDLSARGALAAALPGSSSGPQAFTTAELDEIVWAFNQVGVDRRLLSGWFEVGGGLFGGRGTTIFYPAETLPAPLVVSDVELVVRAIGPGGYRFWEGRALASGTGAVTFPGGMLGAKIVSHGIGTASRTVSVHWFHSGFLPVEVSVNIRTSAPLPVAIERVSEASVHWGAFGGKGDEVIGAGTVATGAGCIVTDVLLELLDANYNVQSMHRMGGPDAGFGGTGARITSQSLGTNRLDVGVHSWFDMGAASRFRIRYTITGTGCSI